MNDKPLFALDEILPLLPHRPPFLFVDRVMELDPYKSILAERTLRPDEPQFVGHFPGRPIMPGVLVAEALAQTSGLLLGLSDVWKLQIPSSKSQAQTSGLPLGLRESLSQANAPIRPKMFFLATTAIKYTRPAIPGDVLRLRATSDKNLSGLFRFNVEARVGGNLIASGSLTLALIDGPQTPAASQPEGLK